MQPETCKKLTWQIFERHGERKKEGVISFIFDVKSKKIYPVPKDVEHATFACWVLGVASKEDIKKNPQLASHLIPVTFEVRDGKIVAALIGTSSLELGLGVRHKRPGDLKAALDMLAAFLVQSEIPVSKRYRQNVVEEFFVKA